MRDLGCFVPRHNTLLYIHVNRKLSPEKSFRLKKWRFYFVRARLVTGQNQQNREIVECCFALTGNSDQMWDWDIIILIVFNCYYKHFSIFENDLFKAVPE